MISSVKGYFTKASLYFLENEASNEKNFILSFGFGPSPKTPYENKL